MPVLKRPSSAADLAPKKRPAAAGSIKEVVSELKQSRDDDDNDQDDTSGVRDKQKAQKFHKMLSQGSLPDHIVHMYNVESKKSNEGMRAYQTKLINSLFQKKEDGSYKIMTDRHEFQEYRKIFHTTVAKDKTESLPRTLMLASHFHGNEVLMKTALDNGELVSRRIRSPESSTSSSGSSPMPRCVAMRKERQCLGPRSFPETKPILWQLS